MAKRENVWDNEGGSPGMPIVKIERGSEAWTELHFALTDDRTGYLRIWADDGQFKIKINELTWTYPLDVEASR